MVDTHFAVQRLAEIYDALDPDRSDLEAYVAVAAEFGASSVLDIGCGTGTLACMLAREGIDVVGVDPAKASVDVARRKPGADSVRWLVGEVTDLPPLRVDLALMTANVAQVFVRDGEWGTTLAAARATLRPGGRLVFETRDPRREAWRSWTREQTYKWVDIPAVGGVETWIELSDVDLPLVSFRTTFVFGSDGAVLTSDSTLRFRGREEVVESLLAAGFFVEDIRDALDRPGLEMVFVAAKDVAGEALCRESVAGEKIAPSGAPPLPTARARTRGSGTAGGSRRSTADDGDVQSFGDLIQAAQP